MRLERLLAIVMLLLERDQVSGTDLAACFEVSTRTIYRDIEAINLAGIPIVTKTGKHGGIGIMPEFKISKRFFTLNDMSALLISLDFASEALSKEEIELTIAKIRSLIPTEKQPEVLLKTKQVLFDSSPWLAKPSFKSEIEQIKSALKNQQQLRFTYLAKTMERTKRIVEPCSLINKDNVWYLHAFCVEKADFRLFKLARMFDLHLLESYYLNRDAPEPFASFNLKMTEQTQPIKLLITKHILEQVTDLCGKENIEQIDDDYYHAKFDFVADDIGYSLLLGLGTECVCLEPLTVRRELIRRLEVMLAHYH